MDYVILGIGVLLIIFSLALRVASDFGSRLIFKIFPFFSGVYLIAYFLIKTGILIFA